MENLTGTCYIYDLQKEKIIFEKKIPRGRGPGEANIITAATVYKNLLIVGVAPQFKVIQFDISDSSFDEFRYEYIAPRQFLIHKDNILIENDLKEKLLVSIKLPLTKNSTPEFYSFEELNIQNEFESNFFKEGTMTVLDNFVYLSTQYKSNIYLFDIERKAFMSKKEFDESKVSLLKHTIQGMGEQ